LKKKLASLTISNYDLMLVAYS